MPDTGAPWNIPYVTSADLVSDWPADSLALANAIDAGLDSAALIKQVVQGLADATFTTTSTTFTAVTGLSVSITPSSASNKVLVLVNTNMTVNNTDAGARGARMSLFADGSNIIAPDTPSNRTPVFSRGTNADYSTSISRPTIQPMSFALLHSPATTSAVTYDVRVSNTAANGTVYVNRSITDTDDATFGRSVSTIMAIEVAA